MRACPCGEPMTERRSVGFGDNIKTRVCACGLVKEVYTRDKEEVRFERFLDGQQTHKNVYNLKCKLSVIYTNKFKQLADSL